MPSQRDVFNWYQEHDVHERSKLGKLGLLKCLSDLKVFSIIIQHFDCIILINLLLVIAWS